MLARSKSRSQIAVNPAMPVNLSHPLNQGLTHWWGANPTWRGGNIYRDVITQGKFPLSGTLTDGGSGLPAWSGNAISFTGSSSQVALPYAVIDQISGGSQIAGSFWFKGTDIQSAYRLQPTNPNYIVMGWRGGSATRQMIISTDGATSGLTFTGTDDGNWHHVIFTWNSGVTNGWQIWVDGKLNAQKNAGAVSLPTMTPHDFPPCFGQWGGGIGSEPTAGTIRDIRLYNKALSPARAQQLYLESRFGNPKTLNWLGTKTYSFKAGGAAGPTTGRLASFYAQFQVG